MAFAQAEPHLLASGTRDAAKLLAQMLIEWLRSSPDSDPASFAARGTVPYLLTTNILAARTFLDQFMSLVVADRPEILIHKEPVPVGGSGAQDEIWATNNHTLNFLQMVVRICQRSDPSNPTGWFTCEVTIMLV